MPVSVFGLSLNETCLKEGGIMSIRCNTRGFPRPNIEFRKNNIKINPEDEMFENVLHESCDQARNIHIFGSDSFSQTRQIILLPNCMTYRYRKFITYMISTTILEIQRGCMNEYIIASLSILTSFIPSF